MVACERTDTEGDKPGFDPGLALEYDIAGLDEALFVAQCSYPTLRRRLAANLFPHPLNNGGRRPVWRRSELKRWLSELPNK